MPSISPPNRRRDAAAGQSRFGGRRSCPRHPRTVGDCIMSRRRALWVALFRLCLHAFPPDFRAQFGDEMLDAFREALRERRTSEPGAAAAFAWASAWDVLKQGGRERFRYGRLPPGHGARDTARGGREAMDGMWTDVRLAWRSLRRSPGFTLAAVAVLALGIGANATVYSALQVAVLAPAPYPEPERLVLVDLTIRRSAERGPEPLIWSFPKFQALLAQEGRLIDPVVGYANRSATLTEAGSPEVVALEVVSPGYFELVGRAPTLGRAFTPEEMGAGSSSAVTVLSEELWRVRFGADPDVLGRSITLNGRRLRVVGVAPDGFDGITGGARLWLPMGAAATVFAPFMLESSGAHWFHVVGRLGDGATLDEARAQMASIGEGIAELYPPPNPGRVFSGSARSLASVRSNEGARASVVLLSLAAALVLLVACANLSGLLLARARRRALDGAVKVAVGASRWRLVRASLVESLLLAASGGAVGVLVAWGGTRMMATAWPARFMNGEDGSLRVTDPEAFGVDPAVLAFAGAVTVLTALVFGVGPALTASRADPATRLRHRGGGGRGRNRFFGLDSRAGLVAGQIALALVLIIAVALVGGSTARLLRVEEGFRTEGLLTFNYAIPTTSSRIADPVVLHDEFLSDVRSIPGVESATFGCAPLRGHCILTRVDEIVGGEEIPEGEGLEIGVRMVDDEHFDVLEIPVLRGRPFDARDGTDPLPTVIINERAARELFPGDDPLGRSIRLGVRASGIEELAEIVGVVGDVLYSPPDVGIFPEAYLSYRDYPETFGNVTIRATGDPMVLVPELRAALERVDPLLALHRVETMNRIIARSVGDRRSTLGLLSLFAAVALLLAATGTWGIVAYSLANRRRELGLRLALGAEEGRVVRTVLDEAVRIALLGIVAGLLLGLSTSHVLEAVLWETEPTDPVVYAAGAAFLLAVVLVASWLPARGAARVDPVEALKAE